MVPRWLRSTACIAVASATLFMQAAVNAAADVDGNSSGGGADTGEVSGATAEGGIVAKVIGGHESGGGTSARENATTLGSGREPGDPPADPARVSDPPSNDTTASDTTTSDTTSRSDETTSNSTETTQTSNEEPSVKPSPTVEPTTEDTTTPAPALFSDLPTPSSTPSSNNTESTTATGSDYTEVAQPEVTVPAVPTEVAAAPSATVVAAVAPDPPVAVPAPPPVPAPFAVPPAPEAAQTAAVVVPATDPITVLQVVLTSAVTTLILAPIAQVSAWFGDGWPPPTGLGSPSPARKWLEPGVTTRADDLTSMLNESPQVQVRSMHAAPLSSNIGGAAMGQVLIPVDEPAPALVAAEAPDVPSDGVGSFLRDAFNEIVHSPPLMVLVIAALPGLAGLVFLTSVGMRLGYCQAKAGLVLRASGLARFAPTGPLGVVRSGSFIVLHQRKAAPRHRVFRDVATVKALKGQQDLRDSA